MPQARPKLPDRHARGASPPPMEDSHGARTGHGHHVGDLNEAKSWYSRAFQQKPYFDESFYVGFNIGGYELGLDPNEAVSKPGRGGSVAYWRVGEISPAVEHFVTSGAFASSGRGRRHQGRDRR
jgi:hypothetical protein